MFRIPFLILLTITLPGAARSAAQADEPPAQQAIARQREIRQLMNRIKKAPQKTVAAKAWRDIQDLGILPRQVEIAIALDRELMNPNPAVRRQASEQLARLPYVTRVVAAHNLRNGVAAETDPDLKWIHAVTLSSILPEEGSAVDVLLANPDDWLLRKSLNVRPPGENDVLTAEELKKHIRQTEAPIYARIDRIGDGEDGSARFVFPRPYPPPFVPPPPPRKDLAHPLIEHRQFDKIVHLMELGDYDARELFQRYGEQFPPKPIAQAFVPVAFGSRDRERQNAIEGLEYSGSDARKVAALASAAPKDFSIKQLADRVAGLSYPGPYSAELLKLFRQREYATLRLAVIAGLGRRGNVPEELMDVLRTSLHDYDPVLCIEAGHALQDVLRQPNVSQPWLKELLMSDEDPLILELVASALKKEAASQEFQKQIFERIDTKRPPDVNLIFIECLIKNAEPKSPAQKNCSH